MFIVIDASVSIVRWKMLSSMKNVDVASRLIDVREGQKLNKMTSMLLSHPGFESICPNSWVLVTATIGLKTNQHLPSAPHDWDKQIQQRGDMNNTKLNELLENIFTNIYKYLQINLRTTNIKPNYSDRYFQNLDAKVTY